MILIGKKCSQDEEWANSPKITLNTYIILNYIKKFQSFWNSVGGLLHTYASQKTPRNSSKIDFLP